MAKNMVGGGSLVSSRALLRLVWTSKIEPSCRNFSCVQLVRTLASAGSNNHTSGTSKRAFNCRSSASLAVSSAAPIPSTSTGISKYNRLLPCPAEYGLPRIEHLVVTEGGIVLDYISKTLDLPPLYVADLIHFGAVHYALVCPKPPVTATLEEIRLYEEVTDLSVLSKRPSIKGKTIREAQKTFRITRVDEFVETGTYLRVHVHPKRFPRCYEIDWRSRVIAVTEHYVVLDKPAGTSVGGTTDNIEESCATFMSRALGLTTPLLTTHQIDNCTEGCVVLARTKEYCSVFHRKIREKQVKKLYRALAAAPVPFGVITHYMRPINMSPRLLSAESITRWSLCQLEVLQCKKIPWPTALIEEKYNIDDCGWHSQEFAYECTINLMTGRTHQVAVLTPCRCVNPPMPKTVSQYHGVVPEDQSNPIIRAQLAGIGAPIVGDSMYMPAAIAEIITPGLNPFGKYNKQCAGESERDVAVEEWIAKHGKEPRVAIGLQACQISWDDGEHFYEARAPWWA